jgi:hypothetical protein
VFERFTDDARDVIIAAQEEARWLRREKIGTEHLLLGIIRVRPGIAQLVPGEPRLLLTVARTAAGAGTLDPPGYIPYAAEAEQAIAAASRLAKGATERIEPEHLLLALLRQHKETPAQRLLTALRADRAALSSWAGRSLPGSTQTVVGAERDGAHRPVGDGTHGPVGDGQWGYPAVVPSRRPGFLRALFGHAGWGSSMEGVRSRNRAWMLAGCAVSLGYAAWAIAAYQGGQLSGGARERWAIAILVALTLSSGALVYWSGKGLGSVAEGWRISGPVKGLVIALGYATAGLLPLAIIACVAIGASILAFGSSRVTSHFTHLGSVSITAQMACLILAPVVLAVAAFAAYTPFWHYSLAPFIAFFSTVNALADSLPDDVIDDAAMSGPDAGFAELRKRRYTVFGSMLMEQLISSTRASILVVLYNFSGRGMFMDDAVATARLSADACLRNPGLAGNYLFADVALGGLADTLWAVFQIRPDLEALQDAIWAREQLADSWILVVSGRARRENDHMLGRLYAARYELTGDQHDLDNALARTRSAVKATRRGSERATVLLALGRAEELRLEHELAGATGEPAGAHGEPAAAEPSGAALLALDAAEAAYRTGAALDGEDDADECRYRLAMLLARKTALTGEASGRQEALRLLRGAIGEPAADAGDGGPAADSGDDAEEYVPPERRARFMIGLANVLVLAATDTAATKEAVAWYRTAAAMTEAPAILRLEAACGWGNHARDPADVAVALEQAVGLLPLAASQGSGYDTVLRQLGRWPELPLDAAAAQLAIGRPERAVELLEYGRVIMWSRRMALRIAPLEQVAAADTGLREQLTVIRSELSAGVLRSGGRRHPGRQNVAAERRAVLYREWDRAMQAHGMSRPAAFAELKAAAAGGPVVLLNVSRRSSDALIITANLPLGHLCLSADIYDKARAVAEASLAASRAAGTAQQSDSAEASQAACDAEDRLQRLADEMVQKWLWSDVTEPVLRWLAEHGKLASDGNALPRLWWCPTGWLTFAPLHAAGSRDTPLDSVMDRVVSSYTPTLAQLIRARDLSRGRSARDGGKVLILAPDSDLLFAPAEADMVALVFAGSYQRLAGDADAESCLHAISRSAVLHFVGHGQASEFRGAGGGSSQLGGLKISPAGQPAFLSARELTDLPLVSARFAYLSVCESATPDRYVPDELTHPAAVLHFGGFPHVIATLRTVPDEFGRAVAHSIYGALVHKGVLDEHRSAEVLHNTLDALRRSEPGGTAPWTTYMHLGP